MNVCSEYFILNIQLHVLFYMHIVDIRFQDMCSTNNDVSCDETSFDIETREEKCEDYYISHLFMISFSLLY